MDDPRVETLLVPEDGPARWTDDTYAALSYENLYFGRNIHEGVDTLILNIGTPADPEVIEETEAQADPIAPAADAEELEEAEEPVSEIPISVYINDELVSVSHLQWMYRKVSM